MACPLKLGELFTLQNLCPPEIWWRGFYHAVFAGVTSCSNNVHPGIDTIIKGDAG